MAFTGIGATIQWYSQQPVKTSLNDTDIIAVEVTGPQGYRSVTFLTIKNWLGTNGATTQYITNLVTQNLYTSNAYVTNLTVFNEFNGKTTITTNLYVDYITNNYAYITNLTVNNGYITNLYVDYITNNTSYITNLYNDYLYTTNLFVTTEYVTNLFVTTINTNFVLYSTNIYNADSYVSNYFTTNVFNDTYVSNFFQTNQIFYQTNLYLTYVSTTNFIDYITNTYVSNFWNTNIYVTDNYVSNYFVTNYNPLIQITSNYTFNVAWPLTNATLYGTTTFSPVSGTEAGRISLRDGGVEKISLTASNGSITANTVLFKTNAWAGPTNNWPMMSGEEQYYVTYTDVNITNFSSLPPTGYGWNGLLVISNAASTNITWRFLSTLGIPERTTSVTVSNASKGMMSGKWSPATGTNGVFRQF